MVVLEHVIEKVEDVIAVKMASMGINVNTPADHSVSHVINLQGAHNVRKDTTAHLVLTVEHSVQTALIHKGA